MIGQPTRKKLAGRAGIEQFHRETALRAQVSKFEELIWIVKPIECATSERVSTNDRGTGRFIRGHARVVFGQFGGPQLSCPFTSRQDFFRVFMVRQIRDGIRRSRGEVGAHERESSAVME